MSIPFSNTDYRIPQGFGNLLEGLTREILREQPDNIPAFAAAYFENLLEKRAKTNFDPAEWGAKVDDRFYNNHAFKVQQPSGATEPEEVPPEKCAPEKDTSQETVKEQETQASFVEETTTDEEEEAAAAAVKIQAAFRGHKARKEMREMKEGSTEEQEME
ncbi:sperm surface protein Sp17 isoform X1 [Phascolarctos cinereus]|uniref:Sperm surface protein Sp17 n=1 Tax=Phascolarctos cinereus TaxID=38626 RepID=A0A6P5LDW7_PHACI|nr:sperm surface protein Sp17 isoform X1 [Phascolarctos cinereus]XP_020856238.1 sperm surface protein Sp17 isoform X1 [Phascolarctos cinereus]